MNHKKEFETILTALGERELSEWELERLWDLIAEDPARMDEYLNVQQMNMSLSKMELNVVEHKPKQNSMSTPLYQRALLIASLLLTVIGVSYFLTQSNLKPQEEPKVVETTQSLDKVAFQEPSTTSSEDAYQKMLSQIPKQGSMNRPPTSFSNATGQNGLSFNEVIRPILSENCFACHGPDAKNAEGDLRLDTFEGATANGAIVPGKPEESEVIRRIMTTDLDDIMPPVDSHKSLSDKEKQLLKQWITEGAYWEEHWAFVKPVKSKLPKGYQGNPIDHFVTEKLKEVNLEQNEPIDRYALARRVSFDLVGLPPVWKEVQAYVQDNSDHAFQKYLDNLFSKSQYGEHQARFWMDAARYGDTHGMHLDNYREMWPYRDWVINAYNQNMPFDQFTIEQIAGDLLPNPSNNQRIATGFNRCNVTTSEGGSIPEELLVRYMTDRVETLGTVFLGLTIGCAACHDHKFDPISQKEFYQFGAYFNNTTQPAMDGNQKDSPPVLTLPNQEHQEEWKSLLSKRTRAHKVIEQAKVNLDDKAEQWWNHKKEKVKLPTLINHNDLNFVALVDDEQAQINGNLIKLQKTWQSDTSHPSGLNKGLMINDSNKNGLAITGSPTLVSNKPFSLSLWVRTPDLVRGGTLFSLGKKHHYNVKDKQESKFIGLEVKLSVQGSINVDLNFDQHKYLKTNLTAEMATTPNTWQHICVRYSGGQAKTSIRITINGKERILKHRDQAFIDGDQVVSGNIILANGLVTGGMSHVRLYNRWLSEEEVTLLANEFELPELHRQQNHVAWNDLNDKVKHLAKTSFSEFIDKESIQANQVIADTQTRRDFIYARSTTTLIMEEKKHEKPSAYILDRGEYDQRTEKVYPALPKMFGLDDQQFPQNRLGLAQWLVDQNNPMTARVTINRLWETVFGRGLVNTPSDFGTMGSNPTHPKLLDWLAVEFMESGWNIQHMLRLMVSSKTYQQNAIATELSLDKDPENKWLSRGPRVRLDAEEIRDQALAVSGLIKHQVGGPSVKPYQPKGLWKVVAFAGSNTKNFKVDQGDKLYRRSLYTFWKRTSPPPSMEAFNAPTRENCIVSRERTNTPLQALVLMNDPQFVEAARYMAQRALVKDSSDQTRLKWLLRETFKRPVSEIDIIELGHALNDFKKHFESAPKMAEDLIKVGDQELSKEIDSKELAAWTMVVNVLMNRDDFINKD